MPHQVSAREHHRVLDATLTCIARVGVAKTTLDDVAREAGCSRATVYRYFPGKQPLLDAVVDARGRALGDADRRPRPGRGRRCADAVVAVLTTGAELHAHARGAAVRAHRRARAPRSRTSRSTGRRACSPPRRVDSRPRSRVPRRRALRAARRVGRPHHLSYLCSPSKPPTSSTTPGARARRRLRPPGLRSARSQ